MPQLNPDPWFTIFVFTWLIFIMIIPSKILKHIFTNEPTALSAEKPKMEPWAWPWH
uniref:ATP synthase complex subunit 8 n=1 Tax=Hemiodopsis gracilis TaxID=270556 RepID=F7UIP8_9TELE|nr:ATP synthase F0 subunit 8 [Hemiodopsis gracilis]BAK42112.1 ATPase subunit 8 [Hemiodopsis gracilis]BBU25531.1 ATPase subunit 8 [Hemiodopsis gracilis]